MRSGNMRAPHWQVQSRHDRFLLIPADQANYRAVFTKAPHEQAALLHYLCLLRSVDQLPRLLAHPWPPRRQLHFALDLCPLETAESLLPLCHTLATLHTFASKCRAYSSCSHLHYHLRLTADSVKKVYGHFGFSSLTHRNLLFASFLDLEI